MYIERLKGELSGRIIMVIIVAIRDRLEAFPKEPSRTPNTKK